MAYRNRAQIFGVLAALAALSLIAAPAAHAARRRAGHAHEHQEAPAITPVPLSQIKAFGGRPAPFALDARAAILVAAHSGAVLYEYNEHEKMQPASLAKLMTFYLTLQALRQGRITLDTEVPISEKAWRLSMNESVSRMFLQVGSKVKVRDLLYGLVVSSGNDAAVALAQYLGGSTDAFTVQMNQMAKKLGLTETHFTNPDGLPMPGEYTTAADMARLARVLTERFPEALTYTSAKWFTWDKIKQPNFNTLLFYDSRVDGLKTGHVEAAGYHLVATSHSDDLSLVSAVLGTPSSEKRRTQTEKLIAWAFDTFTTVQPNWRTAAPAALPVYGGVVNKVAIAPREVPYVTVVKGEQGKIQVAATLDSKSLSAPVKKGSVAGTMTITVDGKPEAEIPLLTQANVKQAGFFGRIGGAIARQL